MPLVTDEIYHVFNRGIDHRPTFTNAREYQRAWETLIYYQFISPPMRLSMYLVTKEQVREKLLLEMKQTSRLIDILSFVFMPNHFHFLVKQKTDGGTSKFLSNLQNSYTRYFNIRYKRKGPLFLDQFKAVRVETDEQLLHVSRYIHLNPYSSFVVKTPEDLLNYKWSSLAEYLQTVDNPICERQTILSFFKDSKTFQKFIFDQADYQRKLESIKHLALED